MPTPAEIEASAARALRIAYYQLPPNGTHLRADIWPDVDVKPDGGGPIHRPSAGKRSSTKHGSRSRRPKIVREKNKT